MPARLTRFAPLLFLAFLTACETVEDRVARHFSRGEALAADGDDARARLEYANALRLDAEHVPTLLAVAELHERAGEWDEMAGYLSRVVDLAPERVDARLSLARLLAISGQMDQALFHADRAVTASPQNPDARAVRALINSRIGNMAVAKSDIAVALVSVPNHAGTGLVEAGVVLAENGPDAALGVIDRYLDANPDDYQLNLVRLALLDGLDRAPEITAQFERMVGLYPEAETLQTGLARWYAEQGETDKAEAAFRTLLERQGTPADTALAFVRFLDELQGAEAAKAELERLIATQTPATPFVMALAERERDAGRLAAAQTRLAALSADDIPVADRLAAEIRLAEIERLAGNTPAAEARIDAVLDEDPTSIEARRFRAALRLEADLIDAAQEDLNVALREKPDDAIALTMVSDIHLRAGNATLAGENLALAMQASQFSEAETVRYVNFLQRNLRQRDAAIVLREAVRRRPGNRTLLNRLAQIQLGLGDWAGAEAVAAELERLGRDPAGAAEIRAAALSAQNRAAEGVALLEAALGEDGARLGQDGSILASLIRGYVQAGQAERARLFLDRVLSDNPDNADARALRAAVLERMAEPAAAEADLRHLLSIRPQAVRSYELLADFQYRQGARAAWEETVAAGLSAADAAGEAPTGLRMRRAGLKQQDGDVAGAIAEYRAIIEETPGNLVAINNLVSLTSDHFADDPARMAEARALVSVLATTAIPEFQDTYGWLLYLDGAHEDALRALVPAARSLPQNPWVQFHAGMAYAALDQASLAQEHLTRALTLAGDTDFPPRADIERTLNRLSDG